MTCTKCDIIRERQGQLHLVGKECDIYGGFRFDYIGRPCRHCNPASHLYKEQ